MHNETGQEEESISIKCCADKHHKKISMARSLNTMKSRFWIALVLTIPVIYLNMLEISPQWQAFFCTLLLIIPGSFIFKNAFGALIQKNLNMFTLISLGIGAAYVYSMVSLITNTGQYYFESAAVILTLVILGQYLESKALAKTTSSITELIKLSPQKAHLVKDNEEHLIDINQIKIKDILRVKPGEKIAADGVIIEGTSYVDESIITGESNPKQKGVEDKVIGGTLNGNGSFLMQVLFIGKDSMLGQMIDLVKEATKSTTQIQSLADRFSNYFTPIVLLIALASFVFWSFLSFNAELNIGVKTFVSVLIIACPCAIGLASPLSITVAIGMAAKVGLLIKNARSLELMNEANVLVVDKTGTLTHGHLEVTDIYTKPEISKEEIIQLVASIEQSSEHPIAMAIVKKAKDMGLTIEKNEDFQNFPGVGVLGASKGHLVAIGNLTFMQRLQIVVEPIIEKAKELQKEGNTALFVAIDQKVKALIVVEDKIKSSTPGAIELLHKDHIKIVMATGDNKTASTFVANKLGIDEVIWGVLPKEKVNIINDLKKHNQIVAMAGDGVNDAAALATADIGIAMGHGSESAIQSAHVTIVEGDLKAIAKLKILSRETIRNIKQNLFFAFIYNIIGIPIAAGILYPWTGEFLNPVIASIAMALSSLSVIGNALRLKKVKL
jgi:Cu+-exporting ATPase